MTVAESLVKRRIIPAPPAWLFALLTLATGSYFAWNAVRAAGPAISSERDVETLLRESREDAAAVEAAMKALAANEQGVVQKMETLRTLRTEQAERRQAELARRVQQARFGYGLSGVLLWGLGIWQLAGRRALA